MSVYLLRPGSQNGNPGLERRHEAHFVDRSNRIHSRGDSVRSRARHKKTVYIEPQQGFETYLAAAMQKKDVPADVVMDKSKAQYWLTAAPIEVHKESNGGKIARCLFAYCAGIEDRANVSVQLVESGSTKVVWAYSVNKGNGQKNTQSMAEAIAKHLKEYLERPVK